MSRRRWVYTSGGRPLPEPIEVSEDWTPPTTEGTRAPYTDSWMDGLRATDGTDIGSRAKRRAYMKANGLADADDFKETWAKARKAREEAARGQTRDNGVREALQRAFEGKRR